MKTFIAMTVALTLSCVATADEVWTTEDGEVAYETEIDRGNIAVFAADGVKMYISGLAGEYTGRGTYEGVWVLDEQGTPDEGCAFDIVRPGTEETVGYWGTMSITFIDADFPSIWIADLGPCFEGFDSQMIGRPKVLRE